MYLINGFGWAFPGFGLDLPTGSGLVGSGLGVSTDWISHEKVHMGNNKSLTNPASTNKIIPSDGVVMVLECIF